PGSGRDHHDELHPRLRPGPQDRPLVAGDGRQLQRPAACRERPADVPDGAALPRLLVPDRPGGRGLKGPRRPTFKWTASADAESYRLEVATTSGFVNIVLDQSGITTLNFTPGADLDRDTEYWWRVTAVNTSGQLLAGNAPRM